jgi:predicted nucleic acid-binding protein
MLFLDTSVFVKIYFKEKGSDATISRCTDPNVVLAASVLSFAEMHSEIARKYRAKEINLLELSQLRDRFERDWENLVVAIDLNQQTMAALPRLVEDQPLKAADAIQLSTALWLNNSLVAGKYPEVDKVLEFCASDQILVECARKCGLLVFNPEEGI